MLFGLTFLIESLFLILFSLLAIPTFGIVICFEEIDLIKRFGDQYIAYKKKLESFSLKEGIIREREMIVKTVINDNATL